MRKLLLTCMLSLGFMLSANAEVDPNFHVYICFGQ